MRITEAISSLEKPRGDLDSRTIWLANKIAAEVRLMLQFKRGAQYREARYTAGYVLRNLSELMANKNTRCFNAPAALLAKVADEILLLPDIDSTDDKGGSAPPVVHPGPEKYALGSAVKVASSADLLAFQKSWHLHHPLDPGQIRFAGQVSTVSEIGYYHGGDVIYHLADTGKFIWHECCLNDP
jgi:hypothetical protein